MRFPYIFLGTALVLLMPCAVFATTHVGYSEEEATKVLRDSEAAWAQSVLKTDPSVAQRILADDLVWILDGRTVDKATAVKEAAEPSGFTSVFTDNVTVRFFGPTAVLQGKDTFTKQDGSKVSYVWTDVWVFRNHQWQVVAAQDTALSTKE